MKNKSEKEKSKEENIYLNKNDIERKIENVENIKKER